MPAEELDDEVAELVDAIARSSPLTVGIGKEAFYAQIELDEHRAYDLTKAVMAMNAARRRRPGRHERLPREAPAGMARTLVRAVQRDDDRVALARRQAGQRRRELGAARGRRRPCVDVGPVGRLGLADRIPNRRRALVRARSLRW